MAADTPGGQTTAATTAMIKAYGHPVRRQILKLFDRREFLRGADVVAALGLPSNKVSFHLRVLAEAGLIVEAPEQARDRRDRVWRSNRGSFEIGGPDHPVDDPAIGDTVLRALVEDHYDIVRRMAAWTPDYMAGRTSEVHGAFAQQTVRLTEDEFVRMMARIDEVKREASEAHERLHPDRDDPDVRVWNIDIVAADDTI